MCIDSPRLPPLFFFPRSSSGYTYETFLFLFSFFLISSFSLSLAAPRLQEEWSSMALICFRASGKRVWILIFFALRASVRHGLRFGLVARGKKEKRETHLKWTDGLSPFSQSAPTPVPGLAETHKAECGKSNRDPSSCSIEASGEVSLFPAFASCLFRMIFSFTAIFYSYVAFGTRYCFLVILLLYSLSFQYYILFTSVIFLYVGWECALSTSMIWLDWGIFADGLGMEVGRCRDKIDGRCD